MQAPYLGVLAALAATIIWSGNFIVARIAALDISAIELNFWRWALATVIILPFVLKSMRREWPSVWQHKWYILFMAVMGISILNSLTYKAGQSTTSINMAILFPCAPIFIMLFSRIFYKEAITLQRALGMFIVLLGIFVIISKGKMANILTVQFNVGDFWILGAVITFALYSLFIRQLPTGISLSTFNGFTFLVGTIILIPFVVMNYELYKAPTFNKNVLISIAYAGVGCSVFSYVLWSKAIKIIGPVKAGFIYYTLPFFTAIEAMYLLNERLTFDNIIGGACIITGILVATLERKASS